MPSGGIRFFPAHFSCQAHFDLSVAIDEAHGTRGGEWCNWMSDDELPFVGRLTATKKSSQPYLPFPPPSPLSLRLYVNWETGERSSLDNHLTAYRRVRRCFFVGHNFWKKRECLRLSKHNPKHKCARHKTMLYIHFFMFALLLSSVRAKKTS